MRKHKLVHSGEKPFQCDRCSYRCSRSGTLKRHMATHLNTDPMKIEHVIDNSLQQQQQQQHHQQLQQPQLQLQQQQEQQHIELQQATVLEAQIPIHIPHHEATQLQEPKYIELTTQQLAQHLPPHSTYSSPPPPPPPTTINLPTVAYRDF